MTAPTWLPDLEEELPLPRTIRGVQPVDNPTGPGKAEIKKYNDKEVRKGLRQLRTGPVTRSREGFVQGGIGSGQDRYLITYRPMPLHSPTPTYVEVHAVKFPKNTPVPGGVPAVLEMPWMSLGQIPAPTVPEATPLSQRDILFGKLVEERVRDLFVSTVLKSRTGAFKGLAHDVVWDELADFYRELAAELSPSGGSFRF
jgi:hypothetical protein